MAIGSGLRDYGSSYKTWLSVWGNCCFNFALGVKKV